MPFIKKWIDFPAQKTVIVIYNYCINNDMQLKNPVFILIFKNKLKAQNRSFYWIVLRNILFSNFETNTVELKIRFVRKTNHYNV